MARVTRRALPWVFIAALTVTVLSVLSAGAAPRATPAPLTASPSPVVTQSAAPGGTPASSPTFGGTPASSPTATVIPYEAPPGDRSPLQGVLAVVAIVVAAGAGIWVYRVIRKGL
jgi:hypothetical protein